MKNIQLDVEVKNGKIFRIGTKGKIPDGKYSLVLTVYEEYKNDNSPEPEQKGLIIGEITSTFAELLWKYMFRIEAGASAVARNINKILSTDNNEECITITSESINKWRGGKSGKEEPIVPEINDKNRHILIACADFLRLDEIETNLFLKVAGFIKIYPDLPQTIFKNYIKNFFKKLYEGDKQIIALFTQAGWGYPPLLDAIRTQAENHYLQENILTIQPPLTTDFEKCFLEFSKQFKCNDVKNEFELKEEIEKKLQYTDEKLFLLITRFEQYSDEVQTALGKMFNSLKESAYTNNLHILLCGGRALEELKYEKGALSFLNHAVDKRWPELGFRDTLAICNKRFPELKPDTDLVKNFLQISGGHPQLLDKCLELKKNLPDLDLLDYPQILSQQCWDIRSPFTNLNDEYTIENIRKLLLSKEETLGIFQSSSKELTNELRFLYWKNLLVIHKDKNGEQNLYWRCKAIWMAGQEILGTEE